MLGTMDSETGDRLSHTAGVPQAMDVEPLSTAATMMGVRLSLLYDPPSTALRQPVPSSSFTMGGYRSAYFVTALIAAASLLNRFATCSSTTSGGSSTSCPYYILLNTRPIALPRPAVFGLLSSSPCHIQDVPNLLWHVAFNFHHCRLLLDILVCVWGPSQNCTLLR